MLADGHGACAGGPCGHDDRGRRQAAASPAGRHRRRGPDGRGRRACRRGRRARPQRDARPRRRPRRRARCGVGGRRSWPRAAGRRRRRPGDLLFARAFAELLAGGDPEAVRALSAALLGAGRGRAAAARRRVGTPSVRVERYLRRCELKTARPVRGRLPAGRAPGRRATPSAAGAPSAGASAWPSRSSTTCWTCPARPSAPASTAAPTCWTAPSRCRSSSPASATPPGDARPALDRHAAARPRRSATASRPPARWTRRAPRALEHGRRAPRPTCPPALPRAQRRALELVADGVVERYA